MSTPATQTPAAPSATPNVAPVAATPAAPSAPAPDKNSLAYYDQLAAAAVRTSEGQTTPPAQPAAPAAATPEESPATAPVADPAQPPTAAALPEGGTPNTEEEIADPTPEELAGLSESGQRALRTERQHRREARAEAKQLREQLQQLTAQVEQLTKATPQTPPAEPTAPANPQAPTPSVVAPALASCMTFEAVDAARAAAAAMEVKAFEMNNALLQNGVDAVAPMLASEGFLIENGQILNAQTKAVVGTADAATLSGMILSAYRGAKIVQEQAGMRKQFLFDASKSWERAAEKMPALKDPKSEPYQRIQHLLRTSPELRQRADGPEVAVKLFLGEQAWSGKPATVTAPVSAPKPPVPPTLPSAPGAPRLSAAGAGKRSEADEIRARIKAGTATLQDFDRLGALNVG